MSTMSERARKAMFNEQCGAEPNSEQVRLRAVFAEKESLDRVIEELQNMVTEHQRYITALSYEEMIHRRIAELKSEQIKKEVVR